MWSRGKSSHIHFLLFWSLLSFCNLSASAGVLLSLVRAALSTGPSWKEPLDPFLAHWSLKYSLSSTVTYLEDKCRLCVVFDSLGKILVKGQNPQNFWKWQFFFLFCYFLTGGNWRGHSFRWIRGMPHTPLMPPPVLIWHLQSPSAQLGMHA